MRLETVEIIIRQTTPLQYRISNVSNCIAILRYNIMMVMCFRCGMIYMEPLQLGWEPLVKSWMMTDLPDCLNTQQRQLITVNGTLSLPMILQLSFGT